MDQQEAHSYRVCWQPGSGLFLGIKLPCLPRKLTEADKTFQYLQTKRLAGHLDPLPADEGRWKHYKGERSHRITQNN